MEFIVGADISSLQAMEDQNAKFYDIDGSREDAVKILARHGVNYIRLRLFHHPTESFDRGDYCDLEHTIAFAKRVKKQGLGLLLDFHYSDFWADWKQQSIPDAWQGQSKEELEQSVYAYTKEVLLKLKKEDALPDMVQIGNEIGKGLLWEYGSLEHPDAMAAFLNAGIDAVYDVEPAIKTMIHIECGADVERTQTFFDTLLKHGLKDYDYLGLSFYPYWAGSYEKLQENLKNIRECYGKDVIIVETAFPYTDETHDTTPNVVTGELTQKTMNLAPSVANQKKVTEDVIEIVRKQPNGKGVFYWEPAWYQVDGVGAAKGMGNEWENQAMFDSTGQALPSICAFGR